MVDAHAFARGCAVNVTVGSGFTVIVKFCKGPMQLLACGTTVNVATIGVDPGFAAVKEAIELPLPEAPVPTVVLLLSQVKVVPVTLDVNTSGVVLLFLQTACDVGVTVIIGVGFTFIVNVFTGPGQVLAVGVTVKLPAVGAVPVLVAVNELIMLPTPDPSTPIVGLLLVHA